MPSPSLDFIHSYGLEPVGVTRHGGQWPRPFFQFSLVACARWESRYIQEWLSYHRSIGIEHVYLYCNDDDPKDLYEQILPFTVGEAPFVTFYHYAFQGLQFQMYFHFLRNHAHETKWLMFLDIDEFICLKKHKIIGDFMGGFPSSIDAVYFNWCSFGANGYKTRPSGSVLVNYTKRESEVTPFTKVFIKSKSVPYKAFFEWSVAPVMHDYTCLNKDLFVINVLGEDIEWYYQEFPDKAWPFLRRDGRSERILDTAFIAHYNIKSDEDFNFRLARGIAGDYEQEKIWAEKDDANRKLHHLRTNAVLDLYLHDYWIQYLDQSRLKSVFPIIQWPLISQGMKASQSSTAHKRSVEEDASSIISGRLTGRPQNHTLIEANPWWMIDLGKTHKIHEMRLFNRLDGVMDRMSKFQLYSSIEGNEWKIEYKKDNDIIFGGANGSPFVVISNTGFDARFLRLVVGGNARYLHLDQIQFFGVSVGEYGSNSQEKLLPISKIKKRKGSIKS